MSTSLAVSNNYDETSVTLWRQPEQVLAEAKQAAASLVKIVEMKKNKVVFNGETYLEFEDWQTVGKFYGCTTKITETKYVEYGGVHGFEAIAVVLDRHQNEIGRVESMCLSDEDNWGEVPVYEWQDELDANGKKQWIEGKNGKKGFFKGKKVQTGTRPKPLFQLRSMAQTRASAKALKSLFSWVVVLAGYQPTPAEEMTGHEFDGRPEPREPVTMPKSTQQTAQAAQQTTQGAQQTNPTQSSATAAQTKTTTTSEPERIAGTIESTKVQKDDLWMVLDKKTVVVRVGKTDAGMVPGARLIVEAVRRAFKNGDVFYETQEVVTLLPPDGEVIEGEIVEPDPVGPTVADAALASDELKGMFGDHPQSREEDAEKQQAQRAKREEVIAKGREGDKPGTAGFARGQRLHILITANAKNTGFGEPELKRFLSGIRLEHARDLPYVKDSKDFAVNTYALCEGMALGEVDWNQYVPD